MKNRILYGFGGVRNFGDDYILDQWVKLYGEMRPDLRIIGARPETWLSGHFYDRVNFNLLPVFQQKYWKIVNELRKIHSHPLESSIMAGELVAEDLMANDSDYLKILKSTEAFHFTGGGYLNKIFVDVWGILTSFSVLSERLGVPLIGTGLGLTPSFEESSAATKIIKKFSILESRDSEGFDRYHPHMPEGSVFSGLDDAFISSVKVNSTPHDPTIYFCIQSDLRDDHNHSRILEKCMRTIDILGGNFKIGYLKFHDGPDSVFLNKLIKASNREINVYTESQLLRDGLPITGNDFCISTRFHLHLLASRLGARGGYVWTGDEYYRVKHKSITDLGSNWCDFLNTNEEDLANLPSPMWNEKELVERKRKFLLENVFSRT